MSELVVKNLHVSIEDKEILKGVDLIVKQGEVHAIMGPNGTGKSTLAYTLMGHPSYKVTSGEIWFKGQNIIELAADERSRLGLFLAFQYPVAIPGVTVANFLRSAVNSRRHVANPEDKGMPIPEFRKMLKEKMELLKMDPTFAGRYLNDGFSGGEKKRAESAGHHTLSKTAELHQAAVCPYHVGRADRRIRRPGPGVATGRTRLRLGARKVRQRARRARAGDSLMVFRGFYE